MTEEEFSELSAKVLTNEATEEERSKHLSVCKDNQSYKETFEDMKSASGLLAENAPLAESMNSKDPEIPEFLLEQLVGEVGQKESLEEEERYCAYPDFSKTNDDNTEGSEFAVTRKDIKQISESNSNTVSFWAKVAMPIAAVLAIAFYINQDTDKGGDAMAQDLPDEPYEVASLDVEFGRWNEQIVRGGDEKKDWVPNSVNSAFYENKTERKAWLENSSEKIRMWIDEDEARIMIYFPNQKEPTTMVLLLEPDKQREQLVNLMESFSFPKSGVMYPIEEGDTLESIAEEFQSTTDWIESANGLKDKNALEEGRELFVPQVD